MDIELLDKNCMPYKKHAKDSGHDMKARIPELVSVGQHDTKIIPLGVIADIPDGYELQLRPRSGMATKGVMCQLGTIDTHYRGELGAIITNTSTKPYHINPYDRVCQAVLKPIVPEELSNMNVVKSVNKDTDRGDKAFGSSGMKGDV